MRKMNFDLYWLNNLVLTSRCSKEINCLISTLSKKILKNLIFLVVVVLQAPDQQVIYPINVYRCIFPWRALLLLRAVSWYGILIRLYSTLFLQCKQCVYRNTCGQSQQNKGQNQRIITLLQLCKPSTRQINTPLSHRLLSINCLKDVEPNVILF